MSDEEQPATGPRCGMATFPPGYYMEMIEGHEFAWENLQAMLFWRRPIHMAVLLVLVELCFFCVYKFQIGFLALVACYYIINRVWALAGTSISNLISKCFQSQYDKGSENESNHIYENPLPFCQRFSHMSSTFYDWVHRRWEKIQEGDEKVTFGSLITWIVLFLVFSVTGSMLPVFIFVHFLLLAPGIIFHPKVNPYVWPYMMKFAKAIQCPYCTLKQD